MKKVREAKETETRTGKERKSKREGNNEDERTLKRAKTKQKKEKAEEDAEEGADACGGWPLHGLPKEGVLAVIWQGRGRGSLDAC